MRKIIAGTCCVLSLIQSLAGAEENKIERGKLYINQACISSEDVVIFGKEVFFPLRAIFENMGATVNWTEETQCVDIDYNGNSYLCELKAPNPDFPELKYIYVNDICSNRYFTLTTMSNGGMYKIIDDTIYLCEYTGIRLFESVGCSVTVKSNELYIDTTLFSDTGGNK